MPPRSQRPLRGKDSEIVVLKQVGAMSNSEIARKLGVTEGAIRHRLKRAAQGHRDGRREKPSRLERFRETISGWVDDQGGRRHRETIKLLYAMLHVHHGYRGSYDALRRYVRKAFPEFMRRRVRVRIETPPGKLSQVDWKEDVKVQIGEPGHWVNLNAFVFTLGFSRKSEVVWSEGKDLPSWLRGHQEAFRAIGGLPGTIRPDCLGSAVVRWNGLGSEITEGYRKYLSKLGVLVFPSRPGAPTDKGKVEKKICDIFGRLDLRHRVFRDLGELQEATRREIEEREREWRCGATGLTVAESFRYEKNFLRPVPCVFPSFPVKEERCRVKRDMTVYFMANSYQLPKEYVDKWVLCTFTGDCVVIHHDGEEIGHFAYLPGTRGMVMLAEKVLLDREIHMSETVRSWGLEVARRQVEIYQEIIKGRAGCN